MTMKQIIIGFLLIIPVIKLDAQTTTTSFDVDGIKVIYKPTIKDIVNVSIYFRGGVNNYTSDKAGIEDLAVNGAVNCGTEKYTKDEFKNKIDLFGIQIGGSASLDYADIKLNCISKYFNEGWDLFAEAVTKPVFNDNAFDELKHRMLNALKASESSPDNRLTTLALETAFEGTPYAINPDGNETTLNAITAQQAKEYYSKTLLNKSRIFIVVVGNISKEDITAKIRAAFANTPTLGYQPVVSKTPDFTDNSIKVEERHLQTNYIMGIMNAPTYNSPDYIPFRLAFSELGGILFSELRIKHNLTYTPQAGLKMLQRPYSYVYVSTTNPSDAVEIIANSINREEDEKIAQKGLDEIKGLYITSNCMKQETGAAIAEELAQAEILGGWQMAEQLPDIISHTTRKEMFKAFKRYINGIKWIYIGDKQKATDAQDAFDLPVR